MTVIAPKGFTPAGFCDALTEAAKAANRAKESAVLFFEGDRWHFFVGEPAEVPAVCCVEVNPNGTIHPFSNDPGPAVEWPYIRPVAGDAERTGYVSEHRPIAPKYLIRAVQSAHTCAVSLARTARPGVPWAGAVVFWEGYRQGWLTTSCASAMPPLPAYCVGVLTVRPNGDVIPFVPWQAEGEATT